VTTQLTPTVFINFLRFKSEYKCLFQYRYLNAGVPNYITLEKLFEYEHSSKFSVNAETRDKLLFEVDGEEFFLEPVNGRIILNEVEEYLKLQSASDLDIIEQGFFSRYRTEHVDCVHRMFRDIKAFTVTVPQLPSGEKVYEKEDYPEIDVSDSREDIIRKVKAASAYSEMALLSLYAYRDMEMTDWEPFIKAAMERNPVCHPFIQGKSPEEIYNTVSLLMNKSVYDGGRLSQPDEVWNFRRGDGVEKAFLMADGLLHNSPDSQIDIKISGDKAILNFEGRDFPFETVKGYNRKISIRGFNYTVS
jgi:hypothetical protein